MAITKPTPAKAKAAEKFVAEAPDAQRERWQRNGRAQVTISLTTELLDQLDAIARRRHLNRSAMLTVLITNALDQEVA